MMKDVIVPLLVLALVLFLFWYGTEPKENI